MKASSGGLTFDSINGWLNSHLGLVGAKGNVERSIKQNEIFRQTNEITDSVFNDLYYSFINNQQKVNILIVLIRFYLFDFYRFSQELSCLI